MIILKCLCNDLSRYRSN